MNDNAAALEARMKAEHFDALYREMEGAGGPGLDVPESVRDQTSRELREQQAERRWLVRRHHDGEHEGHKAAGCAYCWPPGPRGDYAGSL